MRFLLGEMPSSRSSNRRAPSVVGLVVGFDSIRSFREAVALVEHQDVFILIGPAVPRVNTALCCAGLLNRHDLS